MQYIGIYLIYSMRKAFLERAVVDLVYKFREVLLSMFEEVSRSLKYDSNYFLSINIRTWTPNIFLPR